MTTGHTRPTRTVTDLARGLGAALALLGFVVGVPVVLVALAPVYLPQPLPTWSGLWGRIVSPDDGTLLLAVLALVAWITWAAFTTTVLVELVAAARRLRAPSLPMLGGFQRTAARLLATAGLLLATSSAITLPAAPAAASALATPLDHPTPPHLTPTPIPSGSGKALGTTAGAAPAAAPSTALPTVTVQRGDTLWDIAERHLGDPLRYTEIRDLNFARTQPDGHQLHDADWIQPGWTLLLPADATNTEPATTAAPAADEATVVVRPGDTLWGIAAAHLGDGARFPEIDDLNHGITQADGARLTDPDLIRPGWVLRLPTRTAAANNPGAPAAAATDADAPTTTPAAVASPPSGPMAFPQNAVPLPAAPERAQLQGEGGRPARTADVVGDDADVARPARVWFLGFAALGAVGIVGEIARRRHLQQRARKVGETIPLPEPRSEAAAAERTLRSAATPVSIDAIRTTLTNLAYRCFDAGHDLPRIGTLLLDEHHLRLVLVDDAPAPVAPFTASDERTWVAATADVAAEEIIDDPDQVNPYPLLVVLGHTDDATVVLNLEAAGTLAVVGHDTTAEDTLRALVMETATSDLASQLAVHVDEPLADLQGAFEDFRLRATNTRDDRTRTEADIATQLAAAGLDDTLQLRGDCDPADLWLPTIYVEHTLRAAASKPWSGVVTLTRQPADDAWTIQAAADGSARLEPLGIEFQPQRLTTEHAEHLRSLLVTSLPPEPHRIPEEAATTLADDIDAIRTAHPHTPADDYADSPVSIDVLGPIQIRGLPPTAKPLTPRMTELLVYLALHGPTTGADLEDVLWDGERVHRGTRATLAYRTRERVGPEALPKASEDGTFRIGPAIATDWARFQHLISDALACEDQTRIDRLTEALGLVRDRPFRGIGGGQFPWADYDIHQMTSAIADAALLLTRLLHESGQDREALDVAMRGLTIEPFSEALQQQAVVATEAVAGSEAARRLRQRLAAEMARLDPELA